MDSFNPTPWLHIDDISSTWLGLPLAQLNLQTVLRIILISVSLLAAQKISLAAYNIYFSPLSSFPGPKLAAATYIPYYYRKFFGTLNPWVLALHARYGEIVRFTPNDLSFTNEQAYKDIYGHRTATHKANPKPPKFYVKANANTHTLVTEPDDVKHGQIRKVFSNAFSDRALKLQEPLILKYVDKLVSNMKEMTSKNPTTELEIVSLYNFCTFDIMGDLTFSEPLGLLDNNEYSPWVKAVFGGVKTRQKQTVLQAYPILRNFAFLFLPKNFKQILHENFHYSRERVRRRVANPREDYDIWKLVLEKGTGVLQPSEMYTNAGLFMIAGTETTATLLSGLTYHLLRNPDKLAKIVAEVRGQSDEAALNLENLPHLPYLNACFEEGLRVYPPVVEGLPRQSPEGGNTICGKYVPAGTWMWVMQYANNHNPRNFRDAHQFVPERWLEGTGYDSDKKHAMQPFSTGPRNCLGKNLAYHEMRIIFAKVLWNFDLSLSDRSKDWANQSTYIIWEKPGLFVIAKAVR